jgi:hypothetical protein
MKMNKVKKAANLVKKKGQRGDSILAHINPEEAMLLNHHFGGDINPETGLPQYGLFKGGLFKSIGNIFGSKGGGGGGFKKILPVAGTLIGGFFGGPAGAVAGGALGGALSSKDHRLDHALGGAALGLGHGFFSPSIGKSFGLEPGSFLGKTAMMGSPSLGSSLGFSGLGGATRGGAFKDLIGLGMQGKYGVGVGDAAGGGGLGGILGGGGLLNTALLATFLGGNLMGSKKKKTNTPENETLQQAIQRNRHDWGPDEQWFPKVKKQNPPQFPPRNYHGTNWNFFPTPEQQEEQLRRVNEELAQQRFARGGVVKGYYKGKDGGQSDKRPVKLRPKSFIMNATDVSLLGDGNSENGAHVLREWVSSFRKGGPVKDTSPRINALVSDGEFEISPEEVVAIGGGSFDKGVKTINTLRKNLRKHKGATKFLPPKSKSLDNYAGIRR